MFLIGCQVQTIQGNGNIGSSKPVVGLDGSDQGEAATMGNIRPKIRRLTSVSTFSLRNTANDTTISQTANVFDIDNDGENEVFIGFTGYRDYPDVPIMVLDTSGPTKNTAEQIFVDGVPTCNQCTMTIFTDLDGDGDKDLVLSDAGSDDAPFSGTAIEIAVNEGGVFRRITQQIEGQIFGIRSYATAAGNLDGDSNGEIILSSGGDVKKSKVLELRNGHLSIGRNKFVSSGVWEMFGIEHASNMQVHDIDGDGKNDLYVGGSWWNPNHLIFWSGLRASTPSVLPDSTAGHVDNRRAGSAAVIAGGDVISTAIDDFDLDGDSDIVAIIEMVTGNKNGSDYVNDYDHPSVIQVLKNNGYRRFVDITDASSNNLGKRYFFQPLIYDLNQDGFNDIIFNYWSKADGSWAHNNKFGSLVLMNQGGLNFKRVEATSIPGYSSSLKGMIYPIAPTSAGTKILVLQLRGGYANSVNRQFSSYQAEIYFE